MATVWKILVKILLCVHLVWDLTELWDMTRFSVSPSAQDMSLLQTSGFIQENTSTSVFPSKGKKDRETQIPAKRLLPIRLHKGNELKESLWMLDVKCLDLDCSPAYILEAEYLYSGGMCNNCSSMYSIHNGLKNIMKNILYYGFIFLYI